MTVIDFYNSLKFALENKYINEEDLLLIYDIETSKIKIFNGLTLPTISKLEKIELDDNKKCSMIVFDKDSVIEKGFKTEIFRAPTSVEIINFNIQVGDKNE